MILLKDVTARDSVAIARALAHQFSQTAAGRDEQGGTPKQERVVTRLGSCEARPIDIRIVTATNVDLTHAVKQGAFREDIYYRLHVATLHLPALRERPKDILPLVDRFIAQLSERLGFPIPQLSAEGQACLTAYSWPGNVRDLENRIHHILLVSRQLLLQPQDFGSVIAEAMFAQLHHKEVTAEDAFIAALRGLFAAYDSKVYDAVQRLLFNEAYHFCNKN